MKTQEKPTQEHQSRSVANQIDFTKNGAFPISEIVDSRPESIAQRKLQETADVRIEQQVAIQKKANNTGLPDNLKSGIENLSGYAMDDVKVHYNSAKPAQLNAHAYAQGTEIHMAPGQEKHLPHEAWHVVQQKQGRVKPTRQMKGKVNINDDEGLEKEADVMGAKAIQFRANSAAFKCNECKGTNLGNGNPLQLRTIKGEIRTKKDSNNNFGIDVRGVSNPPNLAISNGGNVLVDGTGKRVLGGTNDFMRGHLMKGSWDNNNGMERMTQWNNNVEEVAWTNFEEEAQKKAVSNSEASTDPKISAFTYTVTTETDSPNHGNSVLGAHNGNIPKPWLKNAVNSAAGNANIVNDLRNELNRMVNAATMSIEGDSSIAKYKMAKETIGTVHSTAHQKLKIYD